MARTPSVSSYCVSAIYRDIFVEKTSCRGFPRSKLTNDTVVAVSRLRIKLSSRLSDEARRLTRASVPELSISLLAVRASLLCEGELMSSAFVKVDFLSLWSFCFRPTFFGGMYVWTVTSGTVPSIEAPAHFSSGGGGSSRMTLLCSE